jgi:HSP20 family molecular chaperone IbpA
MIRDEENQLKQVFMKFLNKKNDTFPEKVLEKIKLNTDDKYPHYNLVSKSDGYKDIIEIEVALAGFEKNDIMVFREYDQLTIIGKKNTESKNYIHKGISTRSFRKIFHLFEEVKIESAVLINGMLTISIFFPTETKKAHIQQIEIK